MHPSPVNAIDAFMRTFIFEGGLFVADVQIDDGIIKILNLDVQDPKAAAVLAEYPQVRWAEITRRALKIGLGYLKGGRTRLGGFGGRLRVCAPATALRLHVPDYECPPSSKVPLKGFDRFLLILQMIGI